MRNIVNIINFIRASDPRAPERDMVYPVKRQLELCKQYDFRATFLLQYDALLLDTYRDLLKDTPHEVGGWFEIVQPLCERAGIVWRGREGYSWDWHANVGMTVGYTQEERKKLIDVYMRTFSEFYGRYPSAVGCWIWDAYSLNYLKTKYSVKAACICREQYGTDGYTLWGGYYNGGYYPSKYNALAPARNGEEQIDLPVFRMLGIDPVAQYDDGLDLHDGRTEWQGVKTLEPYSERCGGNPVWVKWYFEENFGKDNGTYAYAQMGQENSMGWENMKGLVFQFEHLDRVKEQNHLCIETLTETGEWFSKTYRKTPHTVFFCKDDDIQSGKKSFWYNSSAYRVNFYGEGDSMWIRDLFLFRKENTENYLTEPCKTENCFLYTLPVVDGNRWTGNGVRAGVYFYDRSDESPVRVTEVTYKQDGETAFLYLNTPSFGVVELSLSEKEIRIRPARNFENLLLKFMRDKSRADARIYQDREDEIKFVFGNVEYGIKLRGGSCIGCEKILFEKDELTVLL